VEIGASTCSAAKHEGDRDDSSTRERGHEQHPRTGLARDQDGRDECGWPHLDPGRESQEHGRDTRMRCQEQHGHDRDGDRDGVDATERNGAEQQQEGDPPPADHGRAPV
jgi:hypothetical protein